MDNNTRAIIQDLPITATFAEIQEYIANDMNVNKTQYKNKLMNYLIEKKIDILDGSTLNDLIDLIINTNIVNPTPSWLTKPGQMYKMLPIPEGNGYGIGYFHLDDNKIVTYYCDIEGVYTRFNVYNVDTNTWESKAVEYQMAERISSINPEGDERYCIVTKPDISIYKFNKLDLVWEKELVISETAATTAKYRIFLINDKLYIFAYAIENEVYEYNTVSKTLTKKTSLLYNASPVTFNDHGACQYDNKVYFLKGDTLYIYNANTDTWLRKIISLSVTPTTNNQIYVSGDTLYMINPSGRSNYVEYDMITNTSNTVSFNKTNTYSVPDNYGAVIFKKGVLYIIGGRTSTTILTDSSWCLFI